MSLANKSIASALWLSLFGAAVSLTFLPLMPAWVSSFMFTVVFPMIVFLVVKNPLFHVKTSVIMGAAGLTFFLSTIFGYIKEVKKAREDPQNNKIDAALYYSLTALMFVIFMFIGSFVTGGDMHNYKGI